MGLSQWPFACSPTNGRKIYCAPGTADGVVVEPMLDGMRYIGKAICTGAADTAYGQPGLENSPNRDIFDSELWTLAGGATSTSVTIPAQCKPYQLIICWDMEGRCIHDTETQRVLYWMFPVIDGTRLFDTPQCETQRILISGESGVRSESFVQLHANPTSVATMSGAAPVLVEARGACFAEGPLDGFFAQLSLVMAMRVYIQFV